MKTKYTFSSKAIEFYSNLYLSKKLPAGIEPMNPYKALGIRNYVESFFQKYFSDNNNRVFVFGINPGRFGAGLTGITFTDPVALAEFCGIKNNLPQKRELSSEFIYKLVDMFGGPKKFYRDFYLTTVCPLGFTRNGRNYNYYDNPILLNCVEPFIANSTNKQLAFGVHRESAIVLGIKNYSIFSDLNKKHGFFKNIYALEHPRYIMQYRRRRLQEYLKKYYECFSKALS